MTYQVTRGKAYAGALRGRRGGKGQFALVAPITRAMATATNLGVLPLDAVVISMQLIGAVVSNAGTTATVSVGIVGGNGHDYLNAFDVKGATGAGQQTPTAATLPTATPLTADTTVTATYAETGTASTSGGPWQCVVEYVV